MGIVTIFSKTFDGTIALPEGKVNARVAIMIDRISRDLHEIRIVAYGQNQGLIRTGLRACGETLSVVVCREQINAVARECKFSTATGDWFIEAYTSYPPGFIEKEANEAIKQASLWM